MHSGTFITRTMCAMAFSNRGKSAMTLVCQEDSLLTDIRQISHFKRIPIQCELSRSPYSFSQSIRMTPLSSVFIQRLLSSNQFIHDNTVKCIDNKEEKNILPFVLFDPKTLGDIGVEIEVEVHFVNGNFCFPNFSDFSIEVNDAESEEEVKNNVLKNIYVFEYTKRMLYKPAIKVVK